MLHAVQLPSRGNVPGTRVGSGTESFDSLHVENDPVFLLRRPHLSERLVYMFAGIRNHLDAGVLPLWNAVLCLDCESLAAVEVTNAPRARAARS